MTSPLVVFDLDGTLIDTAPDLVASLNHTIAAAGLAPVGYEDLTFLVGNGAKMMIEKAFVLREKPLNAEDLPHLLERFITHYSASMPGESRPYPGLVDALERLKTSGFRLAVCTNKIESLAVTLIERLQLTHHFATITGGDTFPVRKPDARHLLGTVERAGADPRRTVMIGDSINDIMVARNAGVPSIAVPFGYSDVAVDSLGPNHVIGHFDELTPALVEGLLQRQAA
ncbi:phosphoglycolate phosphatase [Rhizobiaceae bacterium n13]|uniref:Phosphoglycolate phosphatase n=1 Tax=Ferirhizobium litorale TaxID=2927786 RepID=A0AAE3QJK7_9HYPH|nr:HAD family hydrolase [Fererhizobium litorale]MDI7863865.1 phosphoglycolate phosphatase [Fererhizobium litorale]MDI7924303.1 phosphoglycolate phosphatase [Fererhizobium litorale]